MLINDVVVFSPMLRIVMYAVDNKGGGRGMTEEGGVLTGKG